MFFRHRLSVERRTELASFIDEGERMIAHLRGPKGEEETCEASYIAGCHGARSTVRETIGTGFPGVVCAKFSKSVMGGGLG